LPSFFIQSLLSTVIANSLGYFWLFTISNIFPGLAWIVAAFFFNVKNNNENDI
jgi:hypothetical protein